MDRLSEDEVYLRMAEARGQRSYATRYKVGALLVKDNQIVSDGYNGMPRDFPNDEMELRDTQGNLYTNPLAIHAEANIFDKMSCNGSSIGAKGATLYLALSPCVPCAVRIINNKVVRVVFRNYYRDHSGVELLRSKTKIEIVHLPATEEKADETPSRKHGFWKTLYEYIVNR